MTPVTRSVSFAVALAFLAQPLQAQESRVVISDPLPAGAKARLGIPQSKTQETVFAGGCTNAGALYVASALGKEIQIRAWQAAKLPEPVSRLSMGEAKIVRLALSGDSILLAAADESGKVTVWSLLTGKVRLSTDAVAPVVALALDAKGENLAIAAKKGTTIWNLSTAKAIWLPEQAGKITGIVFAPGGKMIATGDSEGRVRLWRTDTGEMVGVMPWQAMANKATAEAPIPKFSPFGPIEKFPPINLKYVVEFNDAGVRHVCFSPDGKTLAAGGGTVVRTWDVAAKKLLWERNRHSHIYQPGSFAMGPTGPLTQSGGILDLQFSKDGKQVLSSGNHFELCFLDAHTGKDIRVQQVNGYYFAQYRVAFAPGGKSYFVFRAGRDFREFNLQTGKQIAAAGAHATPVLSLAFSPDGKTLASGGDRQIWLWDVDERTALAETLAQYDSFPGLAFSPDGKFLKSGKHYMGRFEVWNVTDGGKNLVKPKENQKFNSDIAGFVPNQPATVITLPHYGSLQTLKLANGETKVFGGSLSDYPSSLAVAPDGKSLVVGFSYYKSPKLLSTTDGKEIRTLAGIAGSDLVVFSPDGRLIAASGQYGDKHSPAHLWDAATGKRYLDLSGHTKPITCLAFSPDGKLLATSGMDNKACLWELATGKLLRTIQGDSESIRAVAFAPKEPILATGEANGTVLLWDVSKELAAAKALPKDLGQGIGPGAETGLWQKRFPMKDRPGGLAFAPDGKTLAVGGQGAIYLLDPATGKEQRQFGKFKNRIAYVTYSKDGKFLASCGYYFDGQEGKEKSVRIWDAASGKLLFGHDKRLTLAEQLAFSPDGKLLFNLSRVVTDGAGATKGVVQMWDWTQQPAEPNFSFPNPWGQTFSLSPDARWLLLTDNTDEMIVWDLDKNKEHIRKKLGTADKTKYLLALAFSGDGLLAASAESYGIIRIWDARTWKQIRELKIPENSHIGTLVFSPDSRRLASGGEPNVGSGDAIRVWDAKTGQLLLKLHAHGNQVAWSADSRWLATADIHINDPKNQAVLLWDIDFLIGNGP